MALLHGHVLLSRHKPCCDGGLPDLLGVLLDCALNYSIVVLQKLSFVDVRCAEIIKIKLVSGMVIGIIGGIRIALHDTHLK